MTARLYLPRGLVALVCSIDYARVVGYSWQAHETRERHYARARIGPGRREYLHRLIAQPPEGMVVHHRNNDGLDCRRENLRVVSPAVNVAYGSAKAGYGEAGYRGVIRSSTGRRWRARVRFQGKTHEIGTFDTPEEAARAYDDAILRIVGPYAMLNFDSDVQARLLADAAPEPEVPF